MYDSQVYNDNIPSFVLSPMLEFTQSDCLLVKKRRRGATSKGKTLNCHGNVQSWVDKIGGECVSGWLLNRENRFIKKGTWIWSFHSAWLTPEQKLVDVTIDPIYQNNEFITFWPDKERKAEWKIGKNYNNIVIFQNAETTKRNLSESVVNPNSGVVYWTTPNLQNLRTIEQHDGIYRHIKREFPDNIKFMEEKYGLTFSDGKIIPLHRKGTYSSELLFDTNLHLL